MGFIVAQISLDTKHITEMSKPLETREKARDYLDELRDGLVIHCLQKISDIKKYSFTTNNNLGYKIMPIIDLERYISEDHLTHKIKKLIKAEKEAQNV